MCVYTSTLVAEDNLVLSLFFFTFNLVPSKKNTASLNLYITPGLPKIVKRLVLFLGCGDCHSGRHVL